MMPVYPCPSLITCVITATSICISTNVPHEVHCCDIVPKHHRGLQGSGLRPGSHSRRGEPVSVSISIFPMSFGRMEERRTAYVTLGLLVVIVVLGRDSLRSGVCELATSAEGRWRGSKAR